jgi:predicted lipid-binding transport protein (Tim44 family)
MKNIFDSITQSISQNFSQNFMSNYLDILIFAVIAIVLLWRLRSVLGTRNEEDAPPIPTNLVLPQKAKDKTATGDAANTSDKSQPNAKQNTERQNDRWAQALPNFNLVATATAHNTLTQFPAFDPAFRPDDFLEKVRKTFALIVPAYANGNKNALELLMSPNLYQHFIQQIAHREAAKETYYTQLHGLQKAIISDASLVESTARITVDFIAEQSITHKDDHGRLIEQRDGRRIVTRDRWVFTRDLKNPSSLWILDDTLVHAE